MNCEDYTRVGLHNKRPGFEKTCCADGVYCQVCGEMLEADDDYYIDADSNFVGCEYCVRRVKTEPE